MYVKGSTSARFRQMEARTKRLVAAGVLVGAGTVVAVVSHPIVIQAMVNPPKRYH